MTSTQLVESVLGFRPAFKATGSRWGSKTRTKDRMERYWDQVTSVVNILTNGYGGRRESVLGTQIHFSFLVWARDEQLLFAGIPSQHLTFSYG